MQSHDLDYKIIGDDIQLVEIELDPGETVIAEAGSMMYMEDGIEMQTELFAESYFFHLREYGISIIYCAKKHLLGAPSNKT